MASKSALEHRLAVRKLESGASAALASYWAEAAQHTTDEKLRAHCESCGKSATAAATAHSAEVDALPAEIAAADEE